MTPNRFTQKFTKTASGCWEWTASTTSRGYGCFSVGKSQSELAHRYAYAAEHGPIPDGHQVYHDCDNKLCVNPDHLYLARIGEAHPASTHLGESNGRAVLTAQDVWHLRVRIINGESSAAEEAKRFNVTVVTINATVKGKFWKEVPMPDPPDMTGWFTMAAAAQQFGVSRKTIHNWALQGILKRRKIRGRVYVIGAAALEEMGGQPATKDLRARMGELGWRVVK